MMRLEAWPDVKEFRGETLQQQAADEAIEIALVRNDDLRVRQGRHAQKLGAANGNGEGAFWQASIWSAVALYRFEFWVRMKPRFQSARGRAFIW